MSRVPIKEESRRVGIRRTLILAHSPGIDDLTGQVRIEEPHNHLAFSQYCTWERRKTYEGNLLHIAPLPTVVLHLPPFSPQGCTTISGIPARPWPLCNELGGEASLEHTRKSWMTKVRTVLGIPVVNLWWRMRLSVILWQSYLSCGLSGMAPMLLEFWKL